MLDNVDAINSKVIKNKVINIVNDIMENQQFPLIYVCLTNKIKRKYKIDVVNTLLEQNININEQDENGLTALMSLCLQNSLCDNPKYNDVKFQIIKLLLEHNADLNKKNIYNNALLYMCGSNNGFNDKTRF